MIHTFHPEFLYNAIRNEKELIGGWRELTVMLAKYICDESETSHLSKAPVATFWRKLVKKFPELVDFLAVTDDETRRSFMTFIDSLYKYFYLPKKVIDLPIYSVLHWTDYGPMAQWLALTSGAEREKFLDYLNRLFIACGKHEMAQTLQKQVIILKLL